VGASAPRHTPSCSASQSQDSGVKLSSSDDSEGVDDRTAPAASSQPARTTQLDCSAGGGQVEEDIVVCGPVEEIDIVGVVEMPTKDISTKHDTTLVPCDAAVVTTLSKKAKKKKKPRCVAKPCKLALVLLFLLLWWLRTWLLGPLTHSFLVFFTSVLCMSNSSRIPLQISFFQN